MLSNFEKVGGYNIHFEKVGTGSQILLLIPGAIGKFVPELECIQLHE